MKKGMRRTVKIVVAVVIVLLVLLFGVQWWLGSQIKQAIEEQVSAQTDGKVNATVGNVRVRLIGRTVHLNDIDIRTDSTRHMPEELPLAYADARIREITLKGVHFNRQDSVTRIRLRKLKIDVSRVSMATCQLVDSTTRHPEKQKDSKAMKLQIGEIDVNLGNIRYEQYQGDDTVTYKLSDLSCYIEDCRLNTRPDTLQPMCMCGDMRMSVSSLSNKFAWNSQLLEVDSLYMDGKKGIFSVGSVRLLPQYAKADFALKVRNHADWTKVITRKIACYGFDMQQMMRDRQLKVDSVFINGANISSYKNRQIEQPQRVKKLFYESVQEFPVPMAVRLIHLQDINVEYQELSVKGESPGTVTFNRLEGTFYGLTNIKSAKETYFTLEARGKLMDQGELQATFRLPVDSLKPHFEVEGKLGKMSALALNSMVEPLTKIRIISGEIDGMDFKITGNSMEARVHMLFLYQDLKVRLLKEKDGEWKTRSFLTNVVNGLLLDANNPDHRGERKAEGKAERDIYRSQFNYLWKTLFAGLKSSVGL